MQNVRTSYFPANDWTIVTGMCPNGQYGAYREQDDGRVRGYGHTRLAAIADLVQAVGEPEDDEFDARAAAFDHARDLRKHEAA